MYNAGWGYMPHSGGEAYSMSRISQYMEFSRMGKGMSGYRSAPQRRGLMPEWSARYCVGGVVRDRNQRRASISPSASARMPYPSISSGEVRSASVTMGRSLI